MKVSTAAALALVGVACASTQQQQPSRASVTAAPAADVQPPAGKSSARSVVRIGEEIRRACGIDDADAHFAFDSTRVSSTDYPTLDKLVRCFVSGPLAKRQMRLVGHADPRGEEEYNLVLGGQRADSVKATLVDRGLSADQAATTSRGEWDAKGSGEPSWAEDRRVDIQLAN
jgi:peptidoglycan-associated lipoprotein